MLVGSADEFRASSHFQKGKLDMSKESGEIVNAAGFFQEQIDFISSSTDEKTEQLQQIEKDVLKKPISKEFAQASKAYSIATKPKY